VIIIEELKWDAWNVGETNTKRLLTIVLAESLETQNCYNVVTARDVSNKERKLL